MRNCLRADFVRLFRSRFFWILILFLFGMDTISAFDEHNKMLDNDLLSVILTVMLLGAVFTAFFIGTDYSDGTIRNKLIVGNRRAAVWFSNLIVCCAAAELMSLSSLLPLTVFGTLSGRVIVLSAGELLFRLLIENLALFAMIALTVLVAMLIKSRSSAIVIGTFLALGLFICAAIVQSRLDEPEYFQGMVTFDEDGNLHYDTETKEPNPTYIKDETLRKALEIAYDVLPTGQANQVSYVSYTSPEFDYTHGGLLLLYSAGVLAAAILIGVPIFQRGNLK